jgi:hypothetical protein
MIRVYESQQNNLFAFEISKILSGCFTISGIDFHFLLEENEISAQQQWKFFDKSAEAKNSDIIS